MTQLLSSEVRQLLHNKFVVILGDSVQRSVYKDLVLLLQKDCLLTYEQLRIKGELSFEQDKLVDGGLRDGMHNGTNYREVREFCTGHHLVRFYFLTRVYSRYVQAVLEELQSHKHTPDVVIMNSCLWDISRYRDDSFSSYRKNLENLFRHLGQVLPESCLLVWNTAMPVGKKITAPFLPPEQLSMALQKPVIEANFYSSFEAQKHNLDVLDLHFHFRHAVEHRHGDGVHWNGRAHRHLSQLLLAHVADAWGVELPQRQSVSQWIKRGPARGRPGQGVERQPQTSRNQGALPPARHGSLLPFPAPHRPRTVSLPSFPPLPPPGHGPLLQLPAPCLTLPPLLPPQSLPIPCYSEMPPQFLLCPQDFSSDQPFQSGQFFNYFHSDVPSPAQTGFDLETDFIYDPQPPRPPFPTPYYQQPAPVVHRGFTPNLRRRRYVPWRQPPKSRRKQAQAHPEPQPH
ncbi:PC-esterase domain-containing protein 1B [Saccopteryx bilineata]|uniref:PC-esterase domain-containing protein 1B n=1 Tax=Saccopteryx bilineata TaxID=59482 RepID=UPI00338E60AB